MTSPKADLSISSLYSSPQSSLITSTVGFRTIIIEMSREEKCVAGWSLRCVGVY